MEMEKKKPPGVLRFLAYATDLLKKAANIRSSFFITSAEPYSFSPSPSQHLCPTPALPLSRPPYALALIHTPISPSTFPAPLPSPHSPPPIAQPTAAKTPRS